MPKFTPHFIEEVRARTNLVDLASKVTKLNKLKGEYLGLCPFHTEKTPSFTVVPEKGFYHCFGCGAHGSALDFVMATENLSFVDAVTVLAQQAGLAVPGDPAPIKRKELKPVVVNKKSIEEEGKDREKRRKSAYKRWANGIDLKGSLGETYLVEGRGIPETTVRNALSLRFSPDAEYWEKTTDGYQVIHRGPALLAAMQWPDDKFAALHTTFLKDDGSGKLSLYKPDGSGQKYPAKKVSGLARGAAIRLTPAAAHMYVGEGIENTLTAIGATDGFVASTTCAGRGLVKVSRTQKMDAKNSPAPSPI